MLLLENIEQNLLETFDKMSSVINSYIYNFITNIKVKIY